MKRILCYGDSNTYGYNPADGSRFDENTRWTALLQTFLGIDYEIIEEGACGRVGFVEGYEEFLLSAQQHFPCIIARVQDVEVLVLAVGANDLQFKYNLSFDQAKKGLERLITIAQEYVKEIVLIPSIVFDENILAGSFSHCFDRTSIAKSKRMGEIYRKLSEIYNLRLFDCNEFVQPSKIDGLHYDETGHRAIADELAKFMSN